MDNPFLISSHTVPYKAFCLAGITKSFFTISLASFRTSSNMNPLVLPYSKSLITDFNSNNMLYALCIL